jgi:hydroxypyruvate reductase
MEIDRTDRLLRLAHDLVGVALSAIDPERRVAEELARRQGDRFGAVLALGKAAAAMALGSDRADADPFLSPSCRRLLIRPHSSPALDLPDWEELSGGHPLPDLASVVAGGWLSGWLAELDADQPLLALISGGASAAVELPASGLTLADLAVTQEALLAGGVAIDGVNGVRKHLSRLKGGGALRACHAPVLALLLSDVPGDDPAVLASGPFAADPGTYAEALAALGRLAVPLAVREHLAAGARGELPETVKPGDPILERVETVLLAGVRTTAAATAAELRRQGFVVALGDLAGEAAEAGADLVARGRDLPGGPGGLVARVLGGETTVTVGPGSGVGGRNQELAVAAARALAGSDSRACEVVLALATDGEDAATGAAGAIVDGGTWEALRRAGIDPGLALARHDSHTALAALPGALLRTGPTGTNAADLAIYLRAEWDSMPF